MAVWVFSDKEDTANESRDDRVKPYYEHGGITIYLKVVRRTIISDSYYGYWRDRLKLPTSHTQDEACLFLEAKGYKFLVDYGYENAVEKAERFPHFGQRGQA